MTTTGNTTEIHQMTSAELDRLMAHYVNAGKELRAKTLREMFVSVFTFKTKDMDKGTALPGALVSGAR